MINTPASPADSRCRICGAPEELVGVLSGSVRLTQCPIWRRHRIDDELRRLEAAAVTR